MADEEWVDWGSYCTLVAVLKERLGVTIKLEVPRDIRNSKPGSKTSLWAIWLIITTPASPKVGQDKVSGGVSVFRLHVTPIANVQWTPLTKLHSPILAFCFCFKALRSRGNRAKLFCLSVYLLVHPSETLWIRLKLNRLCILIKLDTCVPWKNPWEDHVHVGQSWLLVATGKRLSWSFAMPWAEEQEFVVLHIS